MPGSRGGCNPGSRPHQNLIAEDSWPRFDDPDARLSGQVGEPLQPSRNDLETFGSGKVASFFSGACNRTGDAADAACVQDFEVRDDRGVAAVLEQAAFGRADGDGIRGTLLAEQPCKRASVVPIVGDVPELYVEALKLKACLLYTSPSPRDS